MKISANRVTPENITLLKECEVFVFGSNEAGRHSKGAALQAKAWGAVSAVPNGRTQKTYAIPTKPRDVRARLSVYQINRYVDQFIKHAKARPANCFLVTALGCGLAGYVARDIAPLFAPCVSLTNVKLPLSFWHALGYEVER